jgi:hypothetical protein
MSLVKSRPKTRMPQGGHPEAPEQLIAHRDRGDWTVVIVPHPSAAATGCPKEVTPHES